jgi:DNA replication protein DnaC
VRELANLAFLDQATNVLFIGGPGVGKTHLAISLGLKACAARRSVLFSSAADLLDELVAAEVSHNLGKVLAHLRRVDLLIVDELGCAPRGAMIPRGLRDPPLAAAAAGRS